MRKARRERRQDVTQTDSFQPGKPTARPHPMEARIHWLQPKKTALWAGLLVAALILAAPLAASMLFPESEDQKTHCLRFSVHMVMWSFSGSMLLLLVPMLVFIGRVVNTRLGFRDEWVLVEHGNGNVYVSRDEDLLSVNNGFIIEGVTIPTGNPRFPLYNRKGLKEWLQPRLARGEQLGPVQQLAWQWHHRRGLFIAIVTSVIAGCGLIAALETGWMEEHFKGWLETRPECRDVMPEKSDRVTAPQSAVTRISHSARPVEHKPAFKT